MKIQECQSEHQDIKTQLETLGGAFPEYMRYPDGDWKWSMDGIDPQRIREYGEYQTKYSKLVTYDIMMKYLMAKLKYLMPTEKPTEKLNE